MADSVQDTLQRAIDSDGAAQAVCRAISEHLAHGGKLPWPSIAKPYAEWAALQSVSAVSASGPDVRPPGCVTGALTASPPNEAPA